MSGCTIYLWIHILVTFNLFLRLCRIYAFTFQMHLTTMYANVKIAIECIQTEALYL